MTSATASHSSGRSIQYLTFAATGVGCALPGVLLPVLITRWNLHDQQAGLAFFFSWLGSSFGALLVRSSLRQSVIAGGVLVTLGSWGITGAAGGPLPLWMALYGAGMGLTMTSISLVRQRESDDRELVRLNLMWAIGSVTCPWLAARVLQSGSASRFLSVFGICFLALVLATAWGVSRSPAHPRAPATRSRLAAIRTVPFALLLMVCLATGIEASSGAWLTTYAMRLQHGVKLAVAAPTCLWAGLLLSRLIWSLPAITAASASIVRASLWLVAGATILLIANQNPATILVAAFGIGFGLGPLYPMLLTKALLFDESGSIFFLAGLGSASLPWLTGGFSQWTSSLRCGLLAPAGAAALMLLLSSLPTPTALLQAASTSPQPGN